MEGPRACKKEELDKVIELINKVFRAPYGYGNTMGEEFKLMLSEGNLDNMRVIFEGGTPAANVNYYKSTILIEGIPINAASIGAVCTDDNSRGKGYASLLMDDCERIMKEENIRLMLVSGARSLYLRRGCTVSGKCFKFIIKPLKEREEHIQLVEYDDGLLEAMTKIYSRESTRYYRTLKEFKGLLEGATTDWAYFTFKTYLVKDYEDYCAYIVLRIADNEAGRWGYIKEAAGDRKLVYKALKEAMRINSLEYIQYQCTFNDGAVTVLSDSNIEVSHCDILGTIKILDFKGLMTDLMNYFKQHVSSEITDNLAFAEKEGKYIITIKDEKLEINNIQTITKIIFGNRESFEDSYSNKPLIKEFIKNVFPLPFVWPGNLNYQ